jgi:hypothetical protein
VFANRRRRRRAQRILLIAVPLLLLGALLAATTIPKPAPEPDETAKSEPIARTKSPETGKKRAPEPPGQRGSQEDANPESVKGIYLLAGNAGTPATLDAYLDLLDTTELNAVVVDVKDVTGEVMYPSEVPLAREVGATRQTIPDLEALADELEERDVYAIARIATFEDDILPRQRPDLAVLDSVTGGPWLNYSGVAWADPYDREVWEYNVAIAREAAEAGFDEVQFDYVRFPSDGPMETLSYGEETFPTREDAIAGFLEYANEELEPTGVRVAADVFGLTATLDDAGVAQDPARMAPYLDVICPMAYPSHYPPGSFGYETPNAEPYGILENTLADFEQKTREANPEIEIRPWIQDFDYGPPPYGPAEVRAQMRAVYDSGETGWLLWNASNDYTRAALEPADKGPENKTD